MTKFHGEISSPQGASQLTSYDGLTVHLSGKNSGLSIHCYTDRKGNDCFKVYKKTNPQVIIGNELIMDFKEAA